jgi:hypothetical protein
MCQASEIYSVYLQTIKNSSKSQSKSKDIVLPVRKSKGSIQGIAEYAAPVYSIRKNSRRIVKPVFMPVVDNSNLRAALMCAAASIGDLKSLRELDSYGFDVSGSDYDQRAAVHLAAANGHKHILEYMKTVGIDLDVKDRWGANALWEAVQNGHMSCAKFLFANGSKLSFNDDEACQHLFDAVGQNNVAKVQMILK